VGGKKTTKFEVISASFWLAERHGVLGSQDTSTNDQAFRNPVMAAARAALMKAWQ
jgi:hypothetical protein